MSSNGFNVNKFVKDSSDYTSHSIDVVPTPKKRGRKKKEETTTDVAVTQNQTPLVARDSMSYVQSNIPYINAYIETNQQLDDAIAQLDLLNMEVTGQLATVINSKTLKNKYNYINEFAQTASSIIGNKISAIKEKNKTTNDVNNMELKRIKDLKTTASEEDDNVKMANLYSAFINTPIGTGNTTGLLGPSMVDLTMSGPNALPVISSGGYDDQQMWEQNLDPVQNRMLLDAKGLIETVVVYDEATGNRYFDVVDKNTRQSVPNVEKPDNTYIYDLDINVRGGYAKDSNINKSYPLVVINSNGGNIDNY